MNDQQKNEQSSGARDHEIRAGLNQHWAASDANDFETEHRIYHEDAVLEYPQSGERTRGRSNIQNQHASQPDKKRFTIRRIIGGQCRKVALSTWDYYARRKLCLLEVNK
jgi:hypothetical protein